MKKLEQIDMLSGQETKRQEKPVHMHKQFWLRKVERPDFETLIRDIDQLGYRGTGRKYGASDNAIRKWVRYYENQMETV